MTGVGVVSSIGLGRREFFASLAAGTNGISRVEAFDCHTLGREYAGEIKNFHAIDHLTRQELRRTGRCSAMAIAATRMAVRDAGLRPEALSGERTSVVVGTTMGDADVLEDLDHAWIQRGAAAVRRTLLPKYGATLLPIHVARAIGARGTMMSMPAACAAGNYALGFGADLIRSGRADVVVCGSSEVIQQLQFSGFVRLGAMAPRRCQPFDLGRRGLIVGEGAAVLVLESEAHMVRRDAAPAAEIGGYGLSCDAYHITRPRPDAAGSIAAVRQALDLSGVLPAEVDFVNAHGTGTRANDVAEAKVMQTVFSGRRVPISSIKSMIGHCMGAASALEAASCVMTIETHLYPPTIGYDTLDPECDVAVVGNVARPGKADILLNNSLAFGGYNAVTCLARPGVLPPPKKAV